MSASPPSPRGSIPGAAFVLALWAVVYLPRTAFLGFYHDDWWALIEAAQGTAPFSSGRLASFFSWEVAFGSRPLAGLACHFVSSVAGDNAPLWQLANALQVLLAALAVHSLLRTLPGEPAAVRRGALVGTAVVLLNPWSVAMTAWPVTTGSLLSLPFCAWGVRELFRDGAAGPRGVRCLLWLLASFLCYESFYLQWLVFLALVPVLRRDGSGLRPALLVGAAAAAAQVAAVAYNRLIPLYAPDSATKQLNTAWTTLWENSLRDLPMNLARTSPVPGWVWLSLALGASALALDGLVHARRLRWIAALAAAALLLVISALVYAVAGYGITTVGIMGRTSYGLSLGWALAAFALVQLTVASRWRHAALATTLLTVAAGGLLGWAQFKVVSTYAEVWRTQQEVIARFPVEQARALPREGSAVLYVGPSYRDDLVIFGAEWDLTGAINHLPDFARDRRAFADLLRFYPATGLYDWKWDGTVLTQELPGHFRQPFLVQRLYVWNAYTGEFHAVTPGFTLFAKAHPESAAR